MNEISERLEKIISPYVKNQDALKNFSENTQILDELDINSARLVDIVISIEDEFGIEIGDDEADNIQTIGDVIGLIDKKIQ